MNDIISRRAAIDALRYAELGCELEAIDALPSSDVPDRKVGEWDMFELITSVYFGKQYYFVEDNGLVYSRETHKHMTKDEAISEFLDIIGE